VLSCVPGMRPASHISDQGNTHPDNREEIKGRFSKRLSAS
jgi:hypothetical protein